MAWYNDNHLDLDWAARSMLSIRTIGLWALLFTTAASAQPPDIHQTIAALLFPQSKGWHDLVDTPAAPPSTFNGESVETLWGQIDQDVSHLGNDRGCMTVLRLFYGFNGIEPRQSFHAIELPGRATRGLLYSGSAQCREGDITLYWAEPERYGGAKAVEVPGRVLKLQIATSPLATLVSEGCCADPSDTYFLREFLTGAVVEFWTVDKELEIPANVVLVRHTETVPVELVLRRWPAKNDEYDAQRSKFYGTAAYGNIERRYRPGAVVTIIAEWQNKRAERWRLLTVSDSKNRVLSDYSSTGADVGWAQY